MISISTASSSGASLTPRVYVAHLDRGAARSARWLSILISTLGAYATRALAERVADARGRPWLAWLIGGSIVDGIGTWSMHYTGEPALRLQVLSNPKIADRLGISRRTAETHRANLLGKLGLENQRT